MPTDPHYRRAVREQHRAEAITRIYHEIGHGRLTDLPDVFLVIIERALARDMRGVSEFSFNPGYHFLPRKSEIDP